MHFNPIAVLAVISVAAAVPAAMSPASGLLARAINYGAFTAEELANDNVETCCCCKPPEQITNVEHLHRLLEASQKAKRSIDYSQFTAEELANTDVETCCCCVKPPQVQDVDILHRLIAASS